MNGLENVQSSINRIKNHSQQLMNEIGAIKEKDVSASFYVNNLKRLSLQSLDLFNAMQRQINFLSNQKKFIEIKERTSYKRREPHGISVE